MAATLLESHRTGQSARAIRVMPVPRSEPPTDAELERSGVSAPPMMGLLLPLDLTTGVQVQRGRRGRRAVGGRSAGPPGPAAARWGDGDPHPVNPSGRPGVQGHPSLPAAAGSGVPVDAEPAEPMDVRLATRRLVGACVEVVGGYRPLAQLRPFCLPERFDAIVNRLLRPAGRAIGRGQGATRSSIVGGPGGVGSRGVGLRGVGSGGAGLGGAGLGGTGLGGTASRAGRGGPAGPANRVGVRRVQICELSETAAEVAVVMERPDKVWAMAMRLERVRGKWLCCHLEVV